MKKKKLHRRMLNCYAPWSAFRWDIAPLPSTLRLLTPTSGEKYHYVFLGYTRKHFEQWVLVVWHYSSAKGGNFGGGGKNKVVSHVGILVERLRNSHSLEEVQESLDSLLDLSGANPVEVGEGSLRTVVEQLNSLVENSLSESTGQIIQSLLDIICAVCQITKISTEDQKKAALQRTDDFLENVDNVSNVLNLLERAEMWVKLNGIQLLKTLHENRKEKLEETILNCSAGMMRLMDVLTSENVHEKVRNDMLLLLDRLTRENDRIKEFVAFQEGFERLFQIVKREGSSSVVALDCLTVVKNILDGSELTKKLFAQTPCVKELEYLCSPPKPGATSSDGPSGASADPGSKNIPPNEFKRCEMGIEILSQLLRCEIGGEKGMEQKQTISALKAVKTVAAEFRIVSRVLLTYELCDMFNSQMLSGKKSSNQALS